MKALFKTLFGDGPNLVGVAAVVALAAVLALTGHGGIAAYVVPMALLAVVGLLASV
ncbi:MAG: hypothetical protein ACJ8AW_21015 [Rhodopila sp.]